MGTAEVLHRFFKLADDTAVMRVPDHAEPLPEQTIVINGGFAPHTIVLVPARGHRLVFRREETSACSDYVVFPTLGRRVSLPPFEDVAVDLPELSPGSYPITCQRGVLYARIVVRNHRRFAAPGDDAVV